MLISDDCVLKCSSDEYTVKSQSKDIMYKVDILQDTCKESSCSHLCINPACIGLCEHLYQCNCSDNFNLCKHIHKLQSFLLKIKKNNIKEPSLAVVSEDVQMMKKPQVFDNEAERFKKNVDELCSLVNNPMIISLQLPSINRQLEDMIRQAKAIKGINSIDIPMKATLQTQPLNFAPNKKLDKQWQPNKFRKTRKDKRKRKIRPYHYPEQHQKKEIVLKMFQKNVDIIHNEEITIICDDIKTSDFTSTLVRHGPRQLSFISLLTLENRISSDLLQKFRKNNIQFQKGWLQDEVIGSFLHCLEKRFSFMKYCGPTEALALSYSRSIKLLWKDVDTEKIDQVFIPFNPTNSHWILIHLKVKTEEITVIDPLASNILLNNISHKKSIAVAKEIYKRKFNILNPNVISTQSHCLQNDSYNCGVYVCYYALQLCEDF
ncbi:uncharacterized protein LOC136079611 isoform X2 [Hydra vulgaris]|uniref:Uncharacterized protein LOC136079611 isoform X2 n=1 Tax=Hydra vulgaris TaxID=6087 RepID=A0ABM4BRE5_HYDVU